MLYCCVMLEQFLGCKGKIIFIGANKISHAHACSPQSYSELQHQVQCEAMPSEYSLVISETGNQTKYQSSKGLMDCVFKSHTCHNHGEAR